MSKEEYLTEKLRSGIGTVGKPFQKMTPGGAIPKGATRGGRNGGTGMGCVVLNPRAKEQRVAGGGGRPFQEQNSGENRGGSRTLENFETVRGGGETVGDKNREKNERRGGITLVRRVLGAGHYYRGPRERKGNLKGGRVQPGRGGTQKGGRIVSEKKMTRRNNHGGGRHEKIVHLGGTKEVKENKDRRMVCGTWG